MNSPKANKIRTLTITETTKQTIQKPGNYPNSDEQNKALGVKGRFWEQLLELLWRPKSFLEQFSERLPDFCGKPNFQPAKRACHILAVLGSRRKLGSLHLASSELSMVAELLKGQLLVITLSFLSGIFVISGSCSTSILVLGPYHARPKRSPAVSLLKAVWMILKAFKLGPKKSRRT